MDKIPIHRKTNDLVMLIKLKMFKLLHQWSLYSGLQYEQHYFVHIMYIHMYYFYADLPGLRSGEAIPGAPMLLSVRSLTDLEQGNADRQSTISTNIYRSSSDENSCM